MLSRHRRLRLPDRSSLVLGFGVCSLVAVAVFLFLAPIAARLEDAACRRSVRTNAATLQLAAESYAAVHQGFYPRDVRELVPWLPHGRLPRNPLTGEPVRLAPAPGDLTYRSPADGSDYVIEGWSPDPGDALIVLHGRRVDPRPSGRAFAEAAAR